MSSFESDGREARRAPVRTVPSFLPWLLLAPVVLGAAVFWWIGARAQRGPLAGEPASSRAGEEEWPARVEGELVASVPDGSRPESGPTSQRIAVAEPPPPLARPLSGNLRFPAGVVHAGATLSWTALLPEFE